MFHKLSAHRKHNYHSFLRKLTRKVKVPLSKSLENIWNIELLELGIRLKCNKAKEWTPTTDVSIANALNDDSKDRSGKRCSYIRNDESENNSGKFYSSLNVEELAIEEYALGKLPIEENTILTGGGWKGWHSEGFHVRVLFRILVSHSILGFDYHNIDNLHSCPLSLEQFTIFLTPYQSSPLDLHVGHCLLQISQPTPLRSFYERRKREIEDFLDRLKLLSSQELSYLVYESILEKKKIIMKKGRLWDNDSQLVGDLSEARTLSLLAASFGGGLLSSMFRCLFFDYRQYCGGLPDVTLVRAGYSGNSMGHFCDWGDWIGEGFFDDQERNIRALLHDREEEFLGGNLNEKQVSFRGRKQSNVINEATSQKTPDRLHLSHNDKPINLQCMFIEVKSANDSLDERQEDWLNILGSNSEARVCKYVSSKQKG